MVGDVPQGGSVGREAGLVGAGQPPRGVRRENPRERDKTRRRADSERSRGRMAARARGGSGGSAAGRRRTRLRARRVGPGRSPGARVSAGGGRRSVSRATVPDDQHEAGRRLARLDSHERGRGGHSSVRLRSKAGATHCRQGRQRVRRNDVDGGRGSGSRAGQHGCSRRGGTGLVWPRRRRDGRGEGGRVIGGRAQLRRRGRRRGWCRHGSDDGSRVGFGNCSVSERGDRTDHRTERLYDRSYRTADGTRGSDYG